MLIMAPLASNGSCYTAEDIQAAPHLDALLFFSAWSSELTAASSHLQIRTLEIRKCDPES